MSRTPARRPTLLPSVRRLWRGSNQLQLGTDPGRAVMLELTDPASARVLDLLDGSRTEQVLLRAAARLAIAPDDVRLILGELRQAGYVVDAHTLHPAGTAALGDLTRGRVEREALALALRRRRRGEPPGTPAARMGRRLTARVLVTGGGVLAEAIAEALERAGVGRLAPPPAEVETTHIRARPGGPDPRRVAASFAVLVGVSAPATLTAFAHRHLAHLAVAVREAAVVIGPLVRPGLSPCLNCLDLHRMDRDPAWRMLAPQLHEDPRAEPVGVTTVLAAAAFATEQVIVHLEGGTPDTLGATVEIAAPNDTIRRSWSPHPACRCERSRRTRRTKPPAARA